LVLLVEQGRQEEPELPVLQDLLAIQEKRVHLVLQDLLDQLGLLVQQVVQGELILVKQEGRVILVLRVPRETQDELAELEQPEKRELLVQLDLLE
jgi:hypothetical protein